MILRLYLIPAFGRKTARRDQKRRRAAVEGAAGDQVAKDGEQHPRGAERAAEESGRVGSDRADAVHGSSCCPSRKARRRSTISTSTSDSSRSHGRSIRGRTSIVLLGGEAGLAVRRDDRARMGRRRSREAATVRPSVGLERAGGNAEGWTASDMCRSRDGLTAALVEHRHLRSKRVLCQDERLAVHSADRAEPDDPGGAASEREEGRAHPSSHVLLALVDAGCAGEGDSGARGACGSDDDAALHAPEPGGARCGDRPAGTAVRRTKFGDILETGRSVSKMINEYGD